jgi:myo-inositol 2-dehydrogenase/D-chiro-inositol 1-dehydrogenase
LHIGLIGAGRIGSFHGSTLKTNQLVDRLTITDTDLGRASRLALQLGADLAQTPSALFGAGIDALVIAAATPAHAELLHLALDAGCPAFCEKPIALDLATTDAVIEHIVRDRAFVQIGFQRRFDLGYRAAREAVGSGAVGQVHLVRLATHDPVPPPEAYVAESGGIWLDLAIHDFDIGSWVLGSPVVEVYADGQAHDGVFERHLDVDAACAVLRYEGGELGVLSAARNDPRGYDVRMEVFGVLDSLTVGTGGRTPLRSLEPGIEPPRESGYRDFMDRFKNAYQAELHAFLSAVKDGSESPCPVSAARDALVVALAADRSRREHRPVRTEEIQ